jgi:hypothetical protein
VKGRDDGKNRAGEKHGHEASDAGRMGDEVYQFAEVLAGAAALSPSVGAQSRKRFSWVFTEVMVSTRASIGAWSWKN